MKSMQIGSVLKASSSFSKSSFRQAVVPCGQGQVQVSGVDKLSHVRMRRANYLKSSYKHGTIIQQRQRHNSKFEANVASQSSDNVHDPEVFRLQDKEKSLKSTLGVIYKYARPYTLKGASMAIISISLLAVQNLSDITPSFLFGVLQAIVGGCLANVYTAAINQLSDIEIDKVNKPHLVLASGELPVSTAILLTSLYVFLGFCIGWYTKSRPLKLGLFLWYSVGTAYSVHIPLLRWKRNPVLAAMCLWLIHGVIMPILFYLHAQVYIRGRTLLVSKHAIFVSGFIGIFAIVIAIMKDVPDVEGDKINGINSLAVQFGQKKVFWICIWILEMLYAMAIIIGLSSTHIWIRLIMVIGHSIIGFILWRSAKLVDLNNNDAIESFYQFMCKFYFVEYLFVPVLRF